ncbi:MAG: hypothetical protein WA160_08735 [Pseudobdellovibrio sp.]
MTQVTLPAVAKSFYTFCKKCDVDRYHVVLTHTSSTSARIQCEVCKGTKTFSLPKAGSVAKKAATKVKTTGTGTKTTKSRKMTHSDEFQALQTNRSAEKGTPFSIKTKFEMNQKIDHSTFGMGYVKAVQLDRIDVLFEIEVKTLMHNKI